MINSNVQNGGAELSGTTRLKRFFYKNSSEQTFKLWNNYTDLIELTALDSTLVLQTIKIDLNYETLRLENVTLNLRGAPALFTINTLTQFLAQFRVIQNLILYLPGIHMRDYVPMLDTLSYIEGMNSLTLKFNVNQLVIS